MILKKEFESFDWDKKRKSLVVTRQETITLDEAETIEEIKKTLKKKLWQQVQQIKSLKVQAQKTRSLLDKLEGKAGLT